MKDPLSSFENKVIESFRRVKSDMLKVWEAMECNNKEMQDLKVQLLNIENNQKKIIENINYLKKNLPTARLVLNTESNTIHKDNCFFAKNINEENREYFLSEADIRGKNYRRCSCMSA